MQKTLKTGFTPLNWNSQRIPHFIEACNKEVEKFKSVLSEIQKNAVMIEEVVMAIQNSVLVQKEDFMDDEGNMNPPVDISEFYDQIEAKRVSILEVRACGASRTSKAADTISVFDATNFTTHATRYSLLSS